MTEHRVLIIVYQEVKSIKSEYKKKYGNELVDDAIGDTSGDFKDLLVELIKAERDQGTSVDKKQAEKDAKTLVRGILGA